MKLGNIFQLFRLQSLAFLTCVLVAFLSLWIPVDTLQAIPARPGAFQATQPDGSTITLTVHGDEFFNWLEDQDGYTVLTNPVTKQYVYAQLNANVELQRTSHEVGKVNPQAVGLTKKQLPSKAKRQQLRQKKRKYLNRLGKKDQSSTPLPVALLAPSNDPDSSTGGSAGVGTNAPSAIPNTPWIVKNLVLLVAFNDHYDSTNFTVRQEFGFEAADYEPMFNDEGGFLTPANSTKDYFRYNSAGKVVIETTIHPSWIKLPMNESVYIANPTQMVMDALVRADADSTVDFSQFDHDQDGFVDSLTILHSGFDASFSGAVGVWSHASHLSWISQDPGAGESGFTEVAGYYTGPALWGRQDYPNPGQIELSRFGVFAHEMGHHIFALPDLYDDDDSSQGIGDWGLMGFGSWGFDGTQLNPTHLCAWSKAVLGWVTPQIINDPSVADPWGLYTVVDWDTHLTNVSANPPEPNVFPIYRVDLKYENLTVRTSTTVTDILGAIFLSASAVTVSELTYTGSSDAVGVFRGGIAAGLDFESGIVLGTGDVKRGRGPNTGNITTALGTDGSDELANAINPDEPPATSDAAILEFTVQISEDMDLKVLNFNFIFASEEFDDFGIPFDIFSFIVDGVVVSPPPTLGAPNLNPQGDQALYNIEYDGFTSAATVAIPLDAAVDYENEEDYEPGLPHTVKIIIADVTDPLLDSALFIQAGSFSDLPIPFGPEPATEYLLIENREPIGFETTLPNGQGGLAIWHIDEYKADNTDEGYPGHFVGDPEEPDDPDNPYVLWPGNNSHYKVALLQSDGLYDLERLENLGDSNDLYHADTFNTLHEFTYPNTDNYQWGVVDPTHVSISEVGPAASQMCFVYRERATHNDDLDRAIALDCGQFLLDGQWFDGPGCGWVYTPGGFNCENPNVGQEIDPNAEGFLVEGTTILAAESLLPTWTHPARMKHASRCAGFDLNGDPIDPIDIWHKFAPTMTGFVTFDLCSSSNNFDTTLEVFGNIDDPDMGIPPIACSDDVEFADPSCFHQSQLNLFLQAEQTYLIRIAGYNGERGNYTLTAMYSDPPNYDECATPIVLSEGVTFEGTSTGASGPNDVFDVWHEYTAVRTGAVTLSATVLCGSDFNPNLAVFADCSAQVELASNNNCPDDSFNLCTTCEPNDSPRIVMDMVADQTYLVRVAGTTFDHGDYALTVTSAPVNDLCENAIPVPDFDVSGESFTGSTAFATPTLVAPDTGLVSSFGGGGDTIDVWYSYRPIVSGSVKVSLCGSDFDTTLAIYDECGGAELACNDDACGLLGQQSELNLHTIAGETYLLRISGWGSSANGPGEVGDYILKVTGGLANGTSATTIAMPYEYTWVLDQSINVCLSASGGSPPYSNWTTTTLDDSQYSVETNAFSATGAAQGWSKDDDIWTYPLQFTFPFFGSDYTSLKVCSNGFIDFDPATTFPAWNNNTSDLIDNSRIAPMWDDLSMDPCQPGGLAGDDIYIDESVSDQVTIRWQGTNRNDTSRVNVAVTLFSTGQVQFNYGSGNMGLTPTVGLSAGNVLDDHVLITEHDGAASLENAETILYTPGDPLPALPTGVNLDLNSGCLTGTPTEVGEFAGLFQVDDSNLEKGSKIISFIIEVPSPGDLNLDGDINYEDYALFAMQWLNTNCAAINDCQGANLNEPLDDVVDLLDLEMLVEIWLSN